MRRADYGQKGAGQTSVPPLRTRGPTPVAQTGKNVVPSFRGKRVGGGAPFADSLRFA